MSTMRFAVLAATLGLAAAPVADLAAQTTAARRVEFRIPGGALVPSGSLRGAIRNGQVTAAQLSWVMRPTLALTTTFAWARSRDVATAGTPKLDVFTTDLGVEARPLAGRAGRAAALRPFVGVGAGLRSYNYRSLDVDATHTVAGYVAAGGETGIGRVGLRLEVRDYVTGFRPLSGAGAAALRNDVVVMASLSFNRRQGS